MNSLLATINNRIDGTSASIKKAITSLVWNFDPIILLFRSLYTFTRFLIPELCNFKGWALFMDCDMILKTDIKQLFDQADDQYAVMCVQHDYSPSATTKMDGQQQTVYPRKNWSSVMLFNCGHKSNQTLTQDLVNNPEITGAYLHRFSWLKDKEVGELSPEWNWLVGHYKEPEDGTPKLIHYTEGGPWFENMRDCEYDHVWKKEVINLYSS